ncbi:MAG: 4Fe-4S cluster-binding domain-containing protein [Candidatus Woesearchaeota archaeon]
MKEFSEAQLFISGACPSECSYCYLNKSGLSSKINKKIQEKLKNGDYFDNLKKSVGSDIKKLTLIGAEPSLNLDLITQDLEKLIYKFPELKEVMIYSSLAYPDKIINFIKACEKFNIKVILRISLSGPKFITDKIDKSGIMSKIPDNLVYMISNLQEISSDIELYWKTTLSMDSVRRMVKKEERLDEFITFFKKLNLKIEDINNNSNIYLDFNFSPFLASNWKYTKKDGQNLALFIRKAKSRDLLFKKNRLIANFFKKGRITPKGVVCHAGHDSVAVGKSIHPCQLTFLFDNIDYINQTYENSDFEEGVKLVKKNFILDIDNHNSWNFKYLTSTYRNFLKFRIESIKNIAQEMAKVGQIDEKYTKDEWASLLAGLSVCFVRSLMNQKTIQLISTSEMKLLGNGAIEEMVNISLNRIH